MTAKAVPPARAATRRAKAPCLYLVEAFDDGQELLDVAERHGLEGVMCKRRSSPYRSGERRDWRKVKTAPWREADRERRRLFERSGPKVETCRLSHYRLHSQDADQELPPQASQGALRRGPIAGHPSRIRQSDCAGCSPR